MKKGFVIFDDLPTGKENAISSIRLMERYNISDERVLRKYVEQERKDGALILSCSKGYYKSDNREDVKEFVNIMEKRAKSTMYVLRSARAFLKDVDGQISIDAV